MNGHLLRTEAEYLAALDEVEQLIDAESAHRDDGRLEYLALLIEQYEGKHYSIEDPTPRALIEFRAEQGGLTMQEIADLTGEPATFFGFLAGKANLTLPMIWALNEKLGLPIDVLAKRPS